MSVIVLVGVTGYVETHFWHALIPVVLGLLLILLGFVASTSKAGWVELDQELDIRTSGQRLGGTP